MHSGQSCRKHSGSAKRKWPAMPEAGHASGINTGFSHGKESASHSSNCSFSSAEHSASIAKRSTQHYNAFSANNVEEICYNNGEEQPEASQYVEEICSNNGAEQPEASQYVEGLKEEIRKLKNKLKKEKKAKAKFKKLLKEKEEKEPSAMKGKEYLRLTMATEVSNKVQNILETELMCSICTETFIKCAILNCQHVFCALCLKTWKVTSNACPICRTQISHTTHSLVIDTFIDKMVEQLSPTEHMKRQSVINERNQLALLGETPSMETEVPPIGSNRTISTNHSPEVEPEQVEVAPLDVAPPPNLGPMSIPPEEIIIYDDSDDDIDLARYNVDDDDDDDYSSVENFSVLDAYCFICGVVGHWSIQCINI